MARPGQNGPMCDMLRGAASAETGDAMTDAAAAAAISVYPNFLESVMVKSFRDQQ
jgi:hypothetical protein